MHVFYLTLKILTPTKILIIMIASFFIFKNFKFY